MELSYSSKFHDVSEMLQALRWLIETYQLPLIVEPVTKELLEALYSDLPHAVILRAKLTHWCYHKDVEGDCFLIGHKSSGEPVLIQAYKKKHRLLFLAQVPTFSPLFFALCVFATSLNPFSTSDGLVSLRRGGNNKGDLWIKVLFCYSPDDVKSYTVTLARKGYFSLKPKVWKAFLHRCYKELAYFKI